MMEAQPPSNKIQPMKRSPFGNKKLENIEKISWLKLSAKERLEKALSWGREIEMIHQKIYGKNKKLQKLKADLESRIQKI